jgi:hypothetical protein
MLNQFPGNTGHVNMLLWEDAPIFLEEFDKREFLFEVQVIAHVSNLGRLLHWQWDHLTEWVLRLDGCLGGLSLRHDRVWEGVGQGFLQVLELCGCHEYVGHLVALLFTVVGAPNISPDGEDTMQFWHF